MGSVMEQNNRRRQRQRAPRRASPVARLRMHVHRWLVLVAACAVLVLTGAGPGTAQATGVEPGAFVQALGDKTIDVIKEPQSSPDQRKRHVRTLLSESFDLDTIGRFVLGRHWRSATPAQRRQYVTLFRTFILDSYALRLESFRNTIFARFGADAGGIFEALRVRIIQVQRITERDSLVTTEFGFPGRAPLHVAYRVRADNGTLKVVDVIEEGLSLLVTRRSEFAAVVKRYGVAGLLDRLRAPGENAEVKEAALGNAR